MFKGLAVIFAVLSLCACLSLGNGTESPPAGDGVTQSTVEKIDTDYWITPPKSNEIVIIGVSNFQRNREEEIASARTDAARKVSMFYGVGALVENIQNISGFLDHSTESNVIVEYSDQIDQYIDKLNFNPESDVYVRSNGVFVRFTYPASFPGNINLNFGKNANGSPRWTTSPPGDIGGYVVGVGFSRRHARFRDAVLKSAESAVGSIVSNLSTSLQAKDTATAQQGATFIHHQSQGKISGFLILETWIDPSTENVWTLAVARNAN